MKSHCGIPCIFGSGGRTRTCDIHINSMTLLPTELHRNNYLSILYRHPSKKSIKIFDLDKQFCHKIVMKSHCGIPCIFGSGGRTRTYDIHINSMTLLPTELHPNNYLSILYRHPSKSQSKFLIWINNFVTKSLGGIPCIFGSGGRTRTCDIHINSMTLLPTELRRIIVLFRIYRHSSKSQSKFSIWLNNFVTKSLGSLMVF